MKTAIPLPIWLVCLLIAFSAWLGGEVGYFIGRTAGPRIFERKESGFFSRKNVERTNAFFVRFGGFAVIAARFVPIVRTFAPIVAGASAMNYRKFVVYNVAGGFLWAVGFTQLGYWLGNRFPSLGDKIEIVVVVIIVASVLPVAIHLLRERSKSKKAKASV